MKYSGSKPPTVSKSWRRMHSAAPSTHGTVDATSRSKNGPEHARNGGPAAALKEGGEPLGEPRRSHELPKAGFVHHQPASRGEPRTGWLRYPIAADQSRPGNACVGVPLEVVDQRLGRSGVQTRVGVEHEHIVRLAGRHTAVGAGSVTDVGSRTNEARRSVPSYDRCCRDRRRRIIDDNDFAHNWQCEFGDRTKGIIDEIGRLIVDDHNVQTACG